jgi:hypothetical protein
MARENAHRDAALDAKLVFGEDFSAGPERVDLRGRLRW